MKLAISIVLFNVFNTLQCHRLIRPRPPNVANPNPMLTITGTFMCKGVPDGNVRISLVRKAILSSAFAKQFSNRRGQFSMNVRKNQCRIGSYFLQVDHQCKILKQGCFIRFLLPLNITAFLKNSKNSNKPYNLNCLDLIKHFDRQQFLCNKKTDKVFNRN